MGQQLITPEQRQAVDEFRSRHQTGMLALLFSDMIGSRAVKRDLGDAVGVALIERHQQVVRQTLETCPDAREISTAGDSFFIVFVRPSDAVRFALQLHAALRSTTAEASARWPKWRWSSPRSC